MNTTIRWVAAAVAVAVLLGVVGPRPRVEAAGGSLYQVSITQFCRGKVWGSAESASIKVSVVLKNTGPETVQGTFRVTAAAMSPAENPYNYFSTEGGTVTLPPGQSVAFVALGTGVNLARTTTFSAGIGNAYSYTSWYTGPEQIPVC